MMRNKNNIALTPRVDKAARRRRVRQAWHVVIAGLLLSTCASSNYFGIPFGVGQADPELQRLASRARVGNKRAQLELGIMFEEGRGVARDVGKAKSLYRQAASDSGGKIWVYAPSLRDGTGGKVVPIDRPPHTAGLPEARIRLERLTQILDEDRK